MRRARRAGAAGEVLGHIENPDGRDLPADSYGQDGLEALPARLSCEKRWGTRLSDDGCRAQPIRGKGARQIERIAR